MSLHSRLVITFILALVVTGILRLFVQRKLSSGQALLWLSLTGVAEVLALFPSLVASLSRLWGNLWPVSWITFASLVCLAGYLIHQSVVLNQLQAQVITLTREFALLEAQANTRLSAVEEK